MSETIQTAPTSAAEMFRLNKEALFAAMRQAGAKVIVAKYAGYGDSGGIEDVYVEQGASHALDAQGLFWERVWNPVTSSWTTSYARITKTIRDAVQSMTEDAIDLAGYSGYENDDGAEGTVTFDAMQARLTVHHTQYYTESYEHEQEL